MAEKNVKINVKTELGYDTLHPQTKSSITLFNKSASDLSSTNTEDAIKEVNTKANNIKQSLNTSNAKIEENKSSIGVLSSLATSIKNNLVNAINELYNKTIGKTLTSLSQVEGTTQSGFYVDALAFKELSNKLKFTPWSVSDGTFMNPYQNRCTLGASEIYKSDYAISFKTEITMKQPLNVATETIVAQIAQEKYRPKTVLEFPIIEYNYHSLSVLLIYPSGNVSVVIPKGGAIQTNFPNGQQLSLRASYPI